MIGSLFQVDGYTQNCTLPKTAMSTLCTSQKSTCMYNEETISEHLPKKLQPYTTFAYDVQMTHSLVR